MNDFLMIEKVKRDYRIIYRCDVCGKIRKKENIRHRHTPDTHYSAEENWFECVFCEAKDLLPDAQ